MFRERLVDLLKHCYVIGGMPEALAADSVRRALHVRRDGSGVKRVGLLNRLRDEGCVLVRPVAGRGRTMRPAAPVENIFKYPLVKSR